MEKLTQNSLRHKINIHAGFILLLPLILLFDIVYYWSTRASCLNCGSIGEFMATSSLSAHLVGQTYLFFKRK